MAVSVVATLKVQDGKGADFERVFGDFVKTVHATEKGTRVYQLCKSRKEPNTYVVMEIYDNDDALKAHSASEAFKKLGGALATMLAGRPDIQYFDVL